MVTTGESVPGYVKDGFKAIHKLDFDVVAGHFRSKAAGGGQGQQVPEQYGQQTQTPASQSVYAPEIPSQSAPSSTEKFRGVAKKTRSRGSGFAIPSKGTKISGRKLKENHLSSEKSCRLGGEMLPIPSMYDIFTYIFHKNQPNVGKYTIHGWYGLVF